MKVASGVFVLFLVSATLAVEADDKADSVVTKIVNQLKANQTTFRDFHLFRAVDISNYGSYKFNSIEVINTNINFQDAIAVPGAKGSMKGSYLVIKEATIKMPNLTVTGSIIFTDEGGFNFTLPFNATQKSPNNETEGTFKLMDFWIYQDKKDTTVFPGFATYSPENLTLEVKVNCMPLQRKFRAEECYFAQEVVNDLGLGNIAKSLAYKIQTALKYKHLL